MKRHDFIKLIFGAMLFSLALSARAQLAIEITGAGNNRFPVAVSAFEGEGLLPRSLTEVIRADLERSGLFSLIETGPVPLPESSLPDYANFRYRGADALVVGSIFPVDSGRMEVRFRLYDAQRENQIGAMVLRTTAQQYRLTAHRIADYIHEKLTGIPGVFSTRIAYVVKSPNRFDLQIADADGMNPQTALQSREPIISPSWSPDGAQLAYVSFESKKPVVYVHTLATGQRRVVANFRGSNSAPAWAPDGRRLAVVLTKDGGSQLYIVNADGSGIQRLASSSGIDTEPAFSADGRFIYFTSDRGGSPQIYRIASSGGQPERVSFEGNYNVTPRPSPDGKSLAYITRNGGRFQVALQDLATGQRQVLTDSSRDESPSFAPNSRVLIYASEQGGRGVLATVSSDGRIRQRLSVQAGDVREPAWGPYLP